MRNQAESAAPLNDLVIACIQQYHVINTCIIKSNCLLKRAFTKTCGEGGRVVGSDEKLSTIQKIWRIPTCWIKHFQGPLFETNLRQPQTASWTQTNTQSQKNRRNKLRQKRKKPAKTRQTKPLESQLSC